MSHSSASSARFDAVLQASSRQPKRTQALDGERRTVVDFGLNTFSKKELQARLAKPLYREFSEQLSSGGRLSRSIADAVAHSVRSWASERGATHFTHWFQPMTGSTAEKHDAFLDMGKDDSPIELLSGAQLIQGEPDASSFPSGGMRSTFEARGYTGWDPSSPMFLMDTAQGKTLCIPSVFIGYHGQALDKKTPLLRSMQALNREAGALLRCIGFPTESRVVPTVGLEQEYFLIDTAYCALRPDLSIAGRTVCGSQPPKGQALDDHYFGAIPPRVQAFMVEVEHELYKLGVPAKTRHNEVAPSQFELACVFREANVAVDQNQLVMETLRRVAARHSFKAILHEKPFAGVNGSGKHANWSLSVDGVNLLEPGESPSENLRFLTTLTAVLLGVYRHAPALRAAIASYGNDFRLGANEAPPAIISVFLGSNLTQLVEGLIQGDSEQQDGEQRLLAMGVHELPSLVQDNTDRNRTSPFAFTGNKFEFRAVGSSQNPSDAVTAINTVVAEGMAQLRAWIAQEGTDHAAILRVLRKALVESSPVRFDGDGYAEDWVLAAERRGLPNLKKTPSSLTALGDPSLAAVFEKHGVYSPAELQARVNVAREKYLADIDIELRLLREFATQQAAPAARAERAQLIQVMSAAKQMDLKLPRAERSQWRLLGEGLQAMQVALIAIDAAQARCQHDPDLTAELLLPAMDQLRASVDALEVALPDSYWPLPKYREMLFMQL